MSLSRRTFLKKIGLVAGAVAAAPVISHLPDSAFKSGREQAEEYLNNNPAPPLFRDPLEDREEGFDRFASLLKMNELGIISNQTLAEMVEMELNPPVLYYYDPTSPIEPAPLNFSPGAVNYLMYDRERVEILRDGVWTEAPNVTYVTEEEMRDLSSG